MNEIYDASQDMLKGELSLLARASMRGGLNIDNAMKKLVDILKQTDSGNKTATHSMSIDSAYQDVRKILPAFAQRVSDASIAKFAKDKFPNGTN